MLAPCLAAVTSTSVTRPQKSSTFFSKLLTFVLFSLEYSLCLVFLPLLSSVLFFFSMYRIVHHLLFFFALLLAHMLFFQEFQLLFLVFYICLYQFNKFEFGLIS